MSDSFIFEHSCLAAKPELQLFDDLPTQAAVENGYTTEYLPRSNLSDDGPIKFEVSGVGSDYIDLLNSYLLLELKITKADGSNLANDDVVGPINLIGQTLFKQIDVSLNDTLISDSSNLYHYRALFETLLSYTSDEGRKQLSMSLFSKDTPNKMENIADDNTGLVERRNHFTESKTVQVIGRPHSDIFYQHRYIVNGVTLKLKLIRNTDELVLMAAADATFKIKITNASFFVRKVSLNKGIKEKHIEKMDTQLQPALYPIRRVMMKSLTVPIGSLSLTEENLFSGQMPKRIVVGIVDSSSYEGKYEKNPFNFKHFGLKYCCLYVNGKMLPQKPLISDFANGLTLRNYFTLLESTGKSFQDSGLDITRTEYNQGYALLAFDLSPDLEDTGCYHLIKKGNIRLELKFSAGLAAPVNVIVYSEFDSKISIDKNRAVLMDYFV